MNTLTSLRMKTVAVSYVARQPHFEEFDPQNLPLNLFSEILGWINRHKRPKIIKKMIIIIIITIKIKTTSS